MEDKLIEIHQALQSLEIKATPMNITILQIVYRELKQLCKKLEDEKNEREEDRPQDCAE